MSPSCSGYATVRPSSSETTSAWRPHSSSASILSTRATSRRSDQSANLVLRERLERQVGERLTPPQRQRFRERLCALLGELSACTFEQLVELHHVELLRSHTQPVPGRPRLDEAHAEELAQVRDAVLKRRDRPARLFVAPERVQQRVGRHDLVRMEEQHREQGPFAPRAQLQQAVVVLDFDGPEDPELEHRLHLCNRRRFH